MTTWSLELCFVGAEYNPRYEEERTLYEGNSIPDLVKAAEENAFELSDPDAYYYLSAYGGYDCDKQCWNLDDFFDAMPDNITIIRNELTHMLFN